MNQSPSQLLQDNDGHWYLVAEDNAEAFEAAVQLIGSSDEDIMMKGHQELAKLRVIPIDEPSCLRILAWEDMS
jgi:hypothetical protein